MFLCPLTVRDLSVKQGILVRFQVEESKRCGVVQWLEQETHNLHVESSILSTAPNLQALTSMAEDAIDNRVMVVRLHQGLSEKRLSIPTGRGVRLKSAHMSVRIAPGAYQSSLCTPIRQRDVVESHDSARSSRARGI